jgi:branched-chain amino acid transport system ATP-binding protein
MSLVPEGRLLFPSLTVEENLLMGGLNRRPGAWNLARVYELFPILRERRRQSPNALSGGQQHMVAIGRALMSNPKLLLCDEISLGLAPLVVDQIYESLGRIRAEGASIVLVEQDVKRAAGAADRVYCLLKGRVTLHGQARGLSLEQLSHAYFGT